MLKGLTLAITSGLCAEQDDDDHSDDSGTKDEFSFTEMKNLVSSVGATLAPTVHKRVDFLVCSKAAYERNTQKVRKAQKLGVRIVDVQYLIKCKDAGKKLPIADFVLYEPKVKEGAATPDPKKDGKSKEQSAVKDPKKRKGSDDNASRAKKVKTVESQTKKPNPGEVGKSTPKTPKGQGTVKSEKLEKVANPSKTEGNENPAVVPGANAGPKKKSTSNQRKRDRKRAMKAAQIAAKGIAGDVLEQAAKKKVHKSKKDEKGTESKPVRLVTKSRSKKPQSDNS